MRKLSLKWLFSLLVWAFSVQTATAASLLLIDWNTPNLSTYLGGGTLNGRNITITQDSYANSGNVYAGGWVNMLSQSFSMDTYNDQGLAAATKTGGAVTEIAFDSPVTNPYVLFNWTDLPSVTFDFNDGTDITSASNVTTVVTSVGGVSSSATVTSNNVVTASGYSNSSSEGFVVQLTGTFSSIKVTMTGSDDTVGMSIGLAGYSVTTTVGANGTGAVSSDPLSASSTTTQVVEATGSETLAYTFTPSSGYILDTSTSTTTCGGSISTSYTTSAITADCAISAVFALAPSPSISPSTQTVTATINSAISATTAFTASNFSGSVVYTVSPSLPTGLSISASTGVVSGTPTAAQSATTYTVTATYAAASETATAAISITVSSVTSPLLKADVLGSLEATSNNAIRFSANSVKPVTARLKWLRRNQDPSQTSRQGIKVSFADPLLESYVNGTQSGFDSLSFDEKAAASALTQVASNADAAASSLKEKPVEVVMAEMKEILGTVNLNPTAGALVGDWSVWTEGQITVGKVGATSTSSNQDSDSFNIAVGMDRDYGDLGLMGVALNLGKDDVDVGSSGSGIQSNNISLSFYNAKTLPNSLGLETQVGFGKMSIDTTRIDGSQTLIGDRDAKMLFGSIALVDEPLKHGSATLTPYARGEWAYIELDSYAESGGSLALNYDKQHINRYMVFLGSDVSYDTTFANGKLKPFAAFEYGLDLTRDSDIGMNYVGSSTTYSTQLEKTATSNVMVRLGADYQGKDGTTSSVAYERNEAIGAGFSNTLKLEVSIPLN